MATYAGIYDTVLAMFFARFGTPNLYYVIYGRSPMENALIFFSSFLLPPGFQNVIITIVNRTHVVRISAQWGISRSTAPLSHASLHPPPSLPPYMHRHQDHTIFCVFFKLNTQFALLYLSFFCVDIFPYFP